jgi:hypothetical protein
VCPFEPRVVSERLKHGPAVRRLSRPTKIESIGTRKVRGRRDA